MILSVMRDFARTGTKPDARHRLRLLRRRGGGRRLRQPLRRRQPRRAVRGRHGGDLRGRRLLSVPTIGGQRAYLLQTAEKGISWLRLRGPRPGGPRLRRSTPTTPSRGSRQPMTRIGEHKWPVEYTPTVRQFLDGVSELTGVEFDADEDLDAAARASWGRCAGLRGRHPAEHHQPHAAQSRLQAQRHPADRRRRWSTAASCPARRTTLMETVRELAGERVDVEIVHKDVSLEVPFERPPGGRHERSLHAEDPGAEVLPYCLSGGTDNKALEPAGHHGLRLRAAAAAGRPRLRRHVPRRRRARACRRRCASVRGCCRTSCAPADRPTPSSARLRPCGRPA